MMYLARTAPETPASDEFSEPEIAAAYQMNQQKRDRKTVPTIAHVSWLIAKAGGHAPGRKGRLPGAEVLARGLERHAVWVQAVAANRRDQEM